MHVFMYLYMSITQHSLLFDFCFHFGLNLLTALKGSLKEIKKSSHCRNADSHSVRGVAHQKHQQEIFATQMCCCMNSRNLATQSVNV